MPTAESRRELQSAWELVVHLLGAGKSPQGKVDPRLLDEVVAWHGIEAALGQGAERGPTIDPAIHAEWRHASLIAFGESVWRFERVRRILEALAPIPIVVFKGFAYAELIYPSPAARLMGDVDLLVEPARLQEVVHRLQALGFAADGPVDLQHASSFEWTFKRAHLALDVHRGFSFPARLRVNIAEVLARSIPWKALGANARLLSPPDAVLVQALQAPLAEFAPEAAPAMGALDLRLMLQRVGPFWGKVAATPLDPSEVRWLAEEWGGSRMLYAALRWLGRLFPDSRATTEALMPRLPARVARRVDERVVARACPPGFETPSTLERMIRRAILVQPRDRLAVLRQMTARWAPGTRQVERS